ncbi:unnamed protein product, partial [Meganyctiphanes norvegica]
KISVHHEHSAEYGNEALSIRSISSLDEKASTTEGHGHKKEIYPERPTGRRASFDKISLATEIHNPMKEDPFQSSLGRRTTFDKIISAMECHNPLNEAEFQSLVNTG